MNAVPGLDDYLLDLLSGDTPAPASPARPVDHAATASNDEDENVVAVDYTIPEIALQADDIPRDPPFVFVGEIPAVAEVEEAPGRRDFRPDPEPTADASNTAEPEPLPTPVIAIDCLDDLLAEFDSEFPEQAPEIAESPTPAIALDRVDDLLAEFDSEFPAQAPNASASTTADLLAEFDAEFPQQAIAAKPSDAFSEAVAEETEADEIQARIERGAPPAMPAAAMPTAATPIPALPAYAKPVFDLLQKQAMDQAHSPHNTDRRRASDRASRWLRMRCDEQHYALELLKVQEVVLPATLLPLRGAARHMLGVMNLRGQVVPVIDLAVYLGREAVIDSPLTRIVVLEEQGEILGLRVSAVEDVTTLTEQQIEPPDNTRMCRITHPLFRGVARLAQQRTVILLDASELLR